MEAKLEEKQMLWYGHIKRKPPNHIIVNQALTLNFLRKILKGDIETQYMMDVNNKRSRSKVE